MFTETEISEFDSYLAAQVRRSSRSVLDLFSPWGRKKLSDADVIPDFSSMPRPVDRKPEIKTATASEIFPDTKEAKKSEEPEADVFAEILDSAGSLE